MASMKEEGSVAGSSTSQKREASPAESEQKPKKTKTKSRKGCLTCKKKRLKCDETRPFCMNCQSRNVLCSGYATAFKWKSFDEAMPPAEKKPAKQKQTHAQTSEIFTQNSEILQKALEAATLSVTGRSAAEIAIANELIAKGRNPELAKALVSTINNFTKSQEVKTEKREPKKEPPKKEKRRGLSPTDFLNPEETKPEASVAPSELENGLDDESKRSYSRSSQPYMAPSPDFNPPQDGMSPFSMSSPSDFFKVQSPTSTAQSPLNVHSDKSEMPTNPLLEIINSATKPGGGVDSPRLAAALYANPVALEQFQAFAAAASPNFGNVSAPSPSGIQQLLDADQIASQIASPGFSTLISAFTNFEGEMAAPSPANLNSPAPKEEEQDRKSPMALVRFQSASPESGPYDFSRLPRIELGDQSLKMLSAFDRYTCGIMSMKNGPTENPWRTVVLPLAKEYPVMFNALSSMTCFHVARGDSSLRSQGMKHMKTAIVDLVHGLKDKTIPPDVALATCIALAMSEAWDRHISTGIAHLKGARTMIQQILQNIRSNMEGNRLTSGESTISAVSPKSRSMSASSSVESEIESIHRSNSTSSMYRSGSAVSDSSNVPKGLKFLFNAWVYFDVLARMTSDEDDEPYNEEGESAVHDEAPRSRKGPNLMESFRAFNINGTDEIDPLLGVGQSLFPIIGRVASLISRVRRESKNSLMIVSQAVELKSELERWQPATFRNTQIEDPLLDLASAISTAEAYRYSTLIYLHQAVPEIPSKSTHSLAEKVLMLFASIPSSSRTCIAHIFPLLVASCEARPGEERAWCKNRWELLSQKLWIGNVDRALEVVKEVWARKDIYRKRKKRQESEEDEQHARLASQISGYLNSEDEDGDVDLDEDRIKSWTHWTTVMKDWGWEVLLG